METMGPPMTAAFRELLLLATLTCRARGRGLYHAPAQAAPCRMLGRTEPAQGGMAKAYSALFVRRSAQ